MAGLTPPRPLTAADYLAGFDCGRDSLNHWLRRHGWRNQLAGVSRTNVICDSASGALAGFVSLSAGQIIRGALAKPDQRNQPDPVPVLLLGQLAVDKRFQGQGCARSLLWFALNTAVRVSRDIGIFGVITHPLDDDVRIFYQRFGFTTLPADPARAMIVRTGDLLANGFSG